MNGSKSGSRTSENLGIAVPKGLGAHRFDTTVGTCADELELRWRYRADETTLPPP